MKLIESKTYLNLAKAFAGECQAYLRYKFIEYGARYNKMENIAQIVDKIIYNEFNHARMFYTKIQSASKDFIDNIEICSGYPFKEKWDVCENLRLAAEDELAEGEEVYPNYARVAREAGFEEIAVLFENIAQIELYHEAIFRKLYNELSKQCLYSKKENVVWVCDACGYRAEGKEPWEKCPVCLAERQAIHLDTMYDF
jgi:rubrerythrin